MELKAARVAAGHAPIGELEQQFYAILQATKEQFPERFPIVQRNMARPLELYKRSPRFAAFADVDLTVPGELDTVDLAERHRTTVSPFANHWVHIPVAVDGLVNVDSLRDGIVPQAGYTRLIFRLSKVQCVETTSGPGSDEILYGRQFCR